MVEPIWCLEISSHEINSMRDQLNFYNILIGECNLPNQLHQEKKKKLKSS